MQTFPIGTKFMTRGKCPKRCTVVDILKTYNHAGELVRIRYVATHDWMGQTLVDETVTHTTIAMGKVD